VISLLRRRYAPPRFVRERLHPLDALPSPPLLSPRRKWVVLPVLLGAACAEPPTLVPLPPSSSAAWIFAVSQYASVDSEGLQLTAAEGDATPVLLLANRRSLRLSALGYDEALPRLGLAPGPVGPALPCERSCALATPDRRFVLDFSLGHEPIWATVEGLEGVELDALVPDRRKRCDEGCLSLTSTATELAALEGAVFLRPESLNSSDPTIAESALLGLADGSIYRVRGPGNVERVCGPSAILPTAAAYDERSERLWIATSGAIGWVELTSSQGGPCRFTETATTPPGLKIRWMAVVAGAQPPELFALSTSGVLGRFAPGFEAVSSVALAPNEANARSGFMLAVGPWVYAGASGPEVTIVKDDSITTQGDLRLGARGAEARSAVAQQDDVYLGVTTYNLFVQRQRGGPFVPLDEGPGRMASPWEDPDSLVVLGRRLLAPLSRGFIGEWSPRTGYCPLKPGFTFNGNAVKLMLNIQGTLFLADSSTLPQPRFVRWLVPERPEACPAR